MLYFSEITKKNYKTEAECIAAEKAVEKKKSERQKDAESVKALEKKYFEAYENYAKGLNEFIEKYGSYKTTIDKENVPVLRSDIDIFDRWFKNNFWI